MQNTVASSRYVERLLEVRDLILAEHGDHSGGRQSAGFLARMARRLARPPRFAILGEVNSGKTSLANALIGEDLLTTDVIHNSRVPVLLRYAGEPVVSLRREGGPPEPFDVEAIRKGSLEGCLIEVGVPIDCLRDFELIDTPGTTAADEQMHRSVAIARQAHAVIWCTIGTQAWKASEVACARALGARAAGFGVLAVTHADLLDASDQGKVRKRLEAEAKECFSAVALVGMAESVSPAGRESAAGILEILAAARGAATRIQRERERHAAAVIGRFSARLTPADQVQTGVRSEGSEGGSATPEVLQAAE